MNLIAEWSASITRALQPLAVMTTTLQQACSHRGHSEEGKIHSEGALVAVSANLGGEAVSHSVGVVAVGASFLGRVGATSLG